MCSYQSAPGRVDRRCSNVCFQLQAAGADGRLFGRACCCQPPATGWPHCEWCCFAATVRQRTPRSMPLDAMACVLDFCTRRPPADLAAGMLTVPRASRPGYKKASRRLPCTSRFLSHCDQFALHTCRLESLLDPPASSRMRRSGALLLLCLALCGSAARAQTQATTAAATGTDPLQAAVHGGPDPARR